MEDHGSNAKGGLCVDCRSSMKIPGNFPYFMNGIPTETFMNGCNDLTKGAVTAPNIVHFDSIDFLIPLYKHLKPLRISFRTFLSFSNTLHFVDQHKSNPSSAKAIYRLTFKVECVIN